MTEPVAEPAAEELLDLTVVVNGVPRHAKAPARRLLSDFLRHDLRLTGTHVGCEHGVCGACTVLVDGQPMRSCLMFAVTAQAHEVTTVEGLGGLDSMGPVQQAFIECHGLQCGFCTTGMVMSAVDLVNRHPKASEARIREEIEGNLCRCTGYMNIVAAAKRAAQLQSERQ
jgi:carbon-monoxide dehydrogenase small subunit